MKKASIFCAAFVLAFLLSGKAAAAWTDYTDVSGHWAEKTLQEAYGDGLVSGVSESAFAPDAPVTGAQMITLLCRVLGATKSADASVLGLSQDAWYYDAAGKALKLGLINAETGNLDVPMARQDAFGILARAFCLVPAEPDYAVLGGFLDLASVSDKNKAALAALVSGGFVHGSGGALGANDEITRAEFLTVLYRIADTYTAVSDYNSFPSPGGSVLRGSGTLSSISADKLWFDCTSESISLIGVTAGSVTLRSGSLSEFKLIGSSAINQLVVAVGGGHFSLGDFYMPSVAAVRLESCQSAEIGSAADAIELTGSGMTFTVSGTHKSLVVTGSGNTIKLSPNTSIARLSVGGTSNTVLQTGDAGSFPVSCDYITLSGSSNSLSLSLGAHEVSALTIGGEGANVSLSLGNLSDLKIPGNTAHADISFCGAVSAVSVSGGSNILGIRHIELVSASTSNAASADIGSVGALTVPGSGNWLNFNCAGMVSTEVSGRYNTLVKAGTGGIDAFKLTGSENAFTLSSGSTLALAEISGQKNRVTVNGTARSVAVTGSRTTLDGSGTVSELTLSAFGCDVTVPAGNITNTADTDEIDRVLKLVTLGYAGDYTLKWAQEHDYLDEEKMLWVNAKGYSSTTDYLIWINLSMQRVNIFKGSAGAWVLEKSFIVGTGAPGRSTPVGVWKTTYKSWPGWTTSSYTVKPVIGFKSNTGYAFHSRLYRPGTTILSDSSIGYPVSHGCVRMYDADVKYIYDTIPIGTTVVVY